MSHLYKFFKPIALTNAKFSDFWTEFGLQIENDSLEDLAVILLPKIIQTI